MDREGWIGGTDMRDNKWEVTIKGDPVIVVYEVDRSLARPLLDSNH
jgi:hypothetical protein